MHWSASFQPLPDVDKPIRVLHHREGNCWWAESPDVEGWSAAGDSYAEVAKLAEEGIPFALERLADFEHYVSARRPFGRVRRTAAP